LKGKRKKFYKSENLDFWFKRVAATLLFVLPFFITFKTSLGFFTRSSVTPLIVHPP